MQTVWNVYESEINIADANYSGRAHQRNGDIFINADDDATGKDWEAPYAVTFHESGHAIDSIANNKAGHFSASYNNGEFPNTIKSEVSDLVNAKHKEMKDNETDLQWFVQKGYMSKNTADYYQKYGGFKVKKAHAYAAVEKEIRSLSPLQKSDLSDIIEGATGAKIQAGAGHGAKYWKDRTYQGTEWGLATEAFAEMTSASMTNPESLATIKKYLPKSYAVYNNMLKEIANKK